MVMYLSRNSVAPNRTVAIKIKKTVEAISTNVSKAFIEYPGPGNVRELEHTMEHAFVLSSQDVITFSRNS
jgi:transcriptional regulator with PAS, ATPase and Fis domain